MCVCVEVGGIGGSVFILCFVNNGGLGALIGTCIATYDIYVCSRRSGYQFELIHLLGNPVSFSIARDCSR